jgi:hypothetical protein
MLLMFGDLAHNLVVFEEVTRLGLLLQLCISSFLQEHGDPNK